MKILFIHQNAPAQFRQIATRLVREGGHELVYITQKGRPRLDHVRQVEYTPHRKTAKQTHHYLTSTEQAVINAQSVYRAAMQLRDEGFTPDVILGHPGWGETLFVKDVYPNVPLISYCEFYYSPYGADVGFDPEYPTLVDAQLRARIRNAPHLLALDLADICYSPTQWQRSCFPRAYRDRIDVIHDGVDCATVRPDTAAQFSFSSGAEVRRGDPIITYVARNLEPYRGFHSFMRALPGVFERVPDARVIIIGGEEPGYGPAAPNGSTYRRMLCEEVSFPADRVHFLGRVAYDQYLKVLQVSAVHVYLTYPFVLSWSCLEAMAAECLLIGSRTPPVEEVITHGQNGLLVDFFDTGAMAQAIAHALLNPSQNAHLRKAARQTVLDRFDVRTCTERLLSLLQKTAG